MDVNEHENQFCIFQFNELCFFIGSVEELKRVLAEFQNKVQEREDTLSQVKNKVQEREDTLSQV